MHFSSCDIEKMIEYIGSKESVGLANNVENLSNGKEKDGLGKFIFKMLKRNTAEAQAASQIVSIFYNAGILGYNQKSKYMKFWLLNKDWKSLLGKCLDESNKLYYI